MILIRLERLCFLLWAFLLTTMFRATAAAFVALSSPRQPSARQIRYVPWATTATISTKPCSFAIQPCWAAKQQPARFYGSNNNDNSNWKVPDYISIPEHALEFKFVRSSGAGGQNVNKVNTQVQLRFHVPSAYWIPQEVQQRFQQQQKSLINKDGYFSLAAQEHRTQTANRKRALEKLQEALQQAWVRPKERNMRKGISNKTKRQRKEFKRRRSQVKEGRRPVDL